MSHACSNTTVSVSRAACRALGLAAALLAAGTNGSADTIRVTEGAALNDSRFGLELRGQGRGGRPARDAYIAVGPEKGFQNETSLEAGFTLDAGLESPPRSRGKKGVLTFLRLGDLATAPAKVVVFLQHTASGTWFIGARTWDDTTGALVMAGRAPLPDVDAASRAAGLLAPRLVIEWEAAPARAGYVRLMRLRPDGGRALLFEKTDLDNESQVVNRVRLGVVAADLGAGLRYRLFVDDFEVSRLLPSLP